MQCVAIRPANHQLAIGNQSALAVGHAGLLGWALTIHSSRTCFVPAKGGTEERATFCLHYACRLNSGVRLRPVFRAWHRKMHAFMAPTATEYAHIVRTFGVEHSFAVGPVAVATAVLN